MVHAELLIHKHPQVFLIRTPFNLCTQEPPGFWIVYACAVPPTDIKLVEIPHENWGL